MVRGMGRGYGNTWNSRLKPYLPLDTSTMFACQYFIQKIKSYTHIVQHSKQYLTKVPFRGFILYTQQLELLCTASKASPWKALLIVTVGSRISFTNWPNSRFQLNDPVTLNIVNIGNIVNWKLEPTCTMQQPLYIPKWCLVGFYFNGDSKDFTFRPPQWI